MVDDKNLNETKNNQGIEKGLVNSMNINDDVLNKQINTIENFIKYAKRRPRYEELTKCVENILRNSLEKQKIKYALITSRTKSLESFINKAEKPSEEDNGKLKYNNPLSEITDISGVRIVTLFPKDLQKIEDIIKREFDVIEKVNKIDILEEEEKFGYRGVHYLVSLNKNSAERSEYYKLGKLVAEIQVRTTLQNAWAELEHDTQYKAHIILPREIKRRFMILAGMLELADKEFENIELDRMHLAQGDEINIKEGHLKLVEITAQSIKQYIDQKIGADNRISKDQYGYRASLLRRLGFTNLQQVDDCIKGYDTNKISKLLWGNKSKGAVRRFHDAIQAGMGRYYIEKHPLAQKDNKFKLLLENDLETLTKNGIEIKNYMPKNN